MLLPRTKPLLAGLNMTASNYFGNLYVVFNLDGSVVRVSIDPMLNSGISEFSENIPSIIQYIIFNKN